jgi:glycosyltransferase involved in cell wall biosynthesis
VLGADSPGIRELIRHGKTGYLCGTDSEDIRLALEELLTRSTLLKELGSNARKYVVENYSLNKIGNMELNMLKEVANRQ